MKEGCDGEYYDEGELLPEEIEEMKEDGMSDQIKFYRPCIHSSGAKLTKHIFVILNQG